MKYFIKLFFSALLAAALVILPAAAVYGSAAYETVETDVTKMVSDMANYLMEAVPEPGIGQVGGDWAIVALARSGVQVPDGYLRAYYDRATEHIVSSAGVLSSVRYSDYSRVAIAMSAIGADPRNVGGYDILGRLMDYDATAAQGINGPIFALVALSAAGYGDEPVVGRYIECIASKQFADGGFTLSGTVSDPDTTAMAVTALSQYRSREGVAEIIDRALERLCALQSPIGGFASFSSTNSESVSQAIVALCSLGIGIGDERFIKNGNTLLDNLSEYYLEGSGFEHEIGGGASMMATEQALCALAALRRMQEGQCALYDMSDAPRLPADASGSGPGAKHPDVSVPDILIFDIAFSDISGHKNEAEIIALAKRGIINGFPDGEFLPDGTVTRAQFAAMIVRALGLHKGDGLALFADVPEGSWFYDYAYFAYGYGIIKGRSADMFDPEGLITRQEAAVMARRAAALCGIGAELDDTAVRNVLAQFIDYKTIAPWAAGDMAFCFHYGILDEDEAIEVQPSRQIFRCEAAEIVYNILRAM